LNRGSIIIMNIRVAASLVLAACIAATAAALDNGAGKTPLLGWSTWCTDGTCERDYCNEHEIREVATAMQKNGMFALGYKWISLDDCWVAHKRDSAGDLTWNTVRFPSGMPALVAWLHARGFMVGLYTSAGNTTCNRALPGSEHHYQRDANLFAKWRTDYVKVDWCGDVKHLPLDGIMVGAADYKNFSYALTHTTPPATIFYEGVAALIFLLKDAPQYVNGWRASMDHHDNWKNTMEVIDLVEIVGIPGAPGAWSDMDVLMTGGEGCKNAPEHGGPSNGTAHCPGMTATEYITEFTLWSLYQSPLLVSTDVRNMTAVMTQALLNEKLVGIHQSTATPPGRHIGGDKTCPGLGAWACRLFVRRLPNDAILVVLFNAADSTNTITLDFAPYQKQLPTGWSATTAVTAKNAWTNSTSTSVGHFSALVESHGVVAAVLTAGQ
jgi:alpha-galactosidase